MTTLSLYHISYVQGCQSQTGLLILMVVKIASNIRKTKLLTIDLLDTESVVKIVITPTV